MPLFRCLHCQGVSESRHPACEGCGLDAQKSPRDAEFLLKVEVIHFDPPTKVRGRGTNRAACDPRVRVGGGQSFTGEPDSVTCAKCKLTEVFAAADGGSNGLLAIPITSTGVQ